MFDRLFSSPPVTSLEKALTGSALRHRVIGNNIANVNTPGFKRSEVSFEAELASAAQGETNTGGLTRTHEKHLPLVAKTPASPVKNITNTSLRTDGNNVDVDAEMAGMAKNNIFYNAVAQGIGSYYTMLKSAINGGR